MAWIIVNFFVNIIVITMEFDATAYEIPPGY
jgi:hypothetical protein